MRFSESRKWIVTFAVLMVFSSVLILFAPYHAHALTAEEAKIASGKGWYTLPDGKITYKKTASAPATGFIKLKKKWCHFDPEGYLSLGWFTDGGKRYFASTQGSVGKKKGALRSGYAKVEGVFYQFDTKDAAGSFGAQQTGWVTIKKKVFYYSEDGTKQTGLQEVKGNLYFFSTAGSPQNIGRIRTGWKTIGDKKYYFRPTGTAGNLYGAAYRNTTVKIDGKNYTFGEDGNATEKKTQAQVTEAQKRFIEKVGALAHADMLSTGVLASVTVAQAIVESGFGTSTLATKANNLFGMKATLSSSTWKSDWDGKTYAVNTQEYINGSYITIKADFRKYPDYAASVADHSAYLTGAKLSDGKLRYEGLVGCKDYTKAATIIKKGGYATAPNYVPALCDVIERYNLTTYDK